MSCSQTSETLKRGDTFFLLIFSLLWLHRLHAGPYWHTSPTLIHPAPPASATAGGVLFQYVAFIS